MVTGSVSDCIVWLRSLQDLLFPNLGLWPVKYLSEVIAVLVYKPQVRGEVCDPSELSSGHLLGLFSQILSLVVRPLGSTFQAKSIYMERYLISA